MTLLTGFIYAMYFVILGLGFRIALKSLIKNQSIIGSKIEEITHAFFLGVFLHIVIFNSLQILDCPPNLLLAAIGLLVLLSVVLIIWQFKPVFTTKEKHHWNRRIIFITSLVIICSGLTYWSGYILPNIAWDSWAVWEGRAQQWVFHGLNTSIVNWDEWLLEEKSLFNQAANYPEGLSLIYYFPMLISNNSFATTHVVYLFAFAMMSLFMIKRLARSSESLHLLAFFVIILYTTPMISNHLMIQGYADIWMAMYILLLILTFIDFNESKQTDTGISLICYLIVLPMLKLEGWVWLLLFALAYILVRLWQSKFKNWIGVFILLFALLITFGLINFSFTFGDLVINHQRIVIFNLIDTPIQFQNITDQLLISFFWQNNWSIIWLGLPFLILTYFTQRHDQVYRVVQTFFMIAFIFFLFLFYFTEASKWALDLTAINRLILQLTPCYLFLLFNMLIKVENLNHKTKEPKTHP